MRKVIDVRSIIAAGVAASAIALTAVSCLASELNIITINVPGAAETAPLAINNHRSVVGQYVDAAGVIHGFVYEKGTFTTIDPPVPSFSTSATRINRGGEIAGIWADLNGGGHSFLVDKRGLRVIDFPGGAGTGIESINASGTSVGTYGDATGTHSFLLKDGAFTRIDIGTMETSARWINDAGQTVGQYANDDWVFHGFIHKNDHFTTIDVPGAIGTRAVSINDAGQVVGLYFGESDFTGSFLFEKGEFTRIVAPGSLLTNVTMINAAGRAVGYYQDASGVAHGFLFVDGIFTPFDVPGSTYTIIEAINDAGVLVGLYGDAAGRANGFIAENTIR